MYNMYRFGYPFDSLTVLVLNLYAGALNISIDSKVCDKFINTRQEKEKKNLEIS